MEQDEIDKPQAMKIRKSIQDAMTESLPEKEFDEEKIDKLKFLHYSKRRNLWIFIIFFIPGTPKDVLCYFVGLTDIHLSHWVLITSIARLPSVITSTIVAHSAGMQNYTTAVVMLIVTVAISLVGMLFYRFVVNSKNKIEH